MDFDLEQRRQRRREQQLERRFRALMNPTVPCGVDGCDKKRRGRYGDYCQSHRIKFLKYGHPHLGAFMKKSYKKEYEQVKELMHQYLLGREMREHLLTCKDYLNGAGLTEERLRKIVRRIRDAGTAPADLYLEIMAMCLADYFGRFGYTPEIHPHDSAYAEKNLYLWMRIVAKIYSPSYSMQSDELLHRKMRIKWALETRDYFQPMFESLLLTIRRETQRRKSPTGPMTET